MVICLSLGANIGNREHTIQQALTRIEQQVGTITRCSSFYYSAPWGFSSENEFCNICCVVETALSPMEVLRATQAIEQALGRTHKSYNGHYADRTIDIDLIRAFDGEKEMEVRTPELTIPHPLWQQRDFVRKPLEEILPNRSL